MTKTPTIYIGPYDDGQPILKTALLGFDVTNSADDNDIRRRSFNSRWDHVENILMIGVATSSWVSYDGQRRSRVQSPSSGYYFSFSYSERGWRATPAIIPTGLSYVPIWEDRFYDSATKTFSDDSVWQHTGWSGGIYSGSRLAHSGPSSSFPTGCLLAFSWHRSERDTWRLNLAGLNDELVRNVNVNQDAAFDGYPPYPAYPAYPTRPDEPPAHENELSYIVYNDNLGPV